MLRGSGIQIYLQNIRIYFVDVTEIYKKGECASSAFYAKGVSRNLGSRVGLFVCVFVVGCVGYRYI